MFCMQCGESLKDDAKFCHVCGAHQETAESAPKVQRPVVQEPPPVTVPAKAAGGKNWLVIVLSVVIAVVALNVEKFNKVIDKDQLALEEFKKSAEGQTLYKCVGVNGTVEWKIFKTGDTAANVRVVEAQLSKEKERFQIQYLYNLDTKVLEVAFMSKDGTPKSKLIGGLEFGTFCM